MRITRCCQKPEEIIKQLNDWGKEGWEVVQYDEKNTAIGHKTKDAHYFILFKKWVDS